MSLVNLDLPFLKPNPEKQLVQEARQYERDSEVTNNATHPQNTDEMMWVEKQKGLDEIRRWLLDQSPKFQKAFEELSGHRFKDNTLIQIPYIAPLTNINGAYQLINFCKIFDHNVARSNYSEVRINLNLRYGVGYPLISFIKTNYRSLGIKKNYGSMMYLVNYLFNLVEPTYYHALNDGERRHESQIHKVVETKNVLPEEKKKGIL